MTTTQLHEKFQAAIEAADLAGWNAVKTMSVTPMYVGTPLNMMASLTGGDDGGFDPDKPVYFVPDGPCGFAWVNVKAKGTEGRKFMNWLKGSIKTSRPYSAVAPDVASAPRADSYYGGVSIWISGFDQSMQKKERYAQAFSNSLREAGIDGLVTYSMSRMD